MRLLLRSKHQNYKRKGFQKRKMLYVGCLLLSLTCISKMLLFAPFPLIEDSIYKIRSTGRGINVIEWLLLLRLSKKESKLGRNVIEWLLLLRLSTKRGKVVCLSLKVGRVSFF